MWLNCIFQSNSLSHNRKEYLNLRNTEFYGVIISKRQNGDYPRANRYVILKNGRKVEVYNEIYREINAGDSVVKTKGQDTICFYLNNGKILTQDYCKYPREHYLKLLDKQNEHN